MRLIDADAIKYTARFTDYADGRMTSDAVITKCEIDSMPTVDPDRHERWIPCSERLPEKNGRYLVTNSAWGAMEVDWNACVDGAWVFSNTKPIAWMPLPEPYKMGGDENER